MPRPLFFRFSECLADYVDFQYPQQRVDARQPGIKWRVFYREFRRETSAPTTASSIRRRISISFCSPAGPMNG